MKKLLYILTILLTFCLFKVNVFADTTHVKLKLTGSYGGIFSPTSDLVKYTSFVSPYNSDYVYDLYHLKSESPFVSYAIFKHKTEDFYYFLYFLDDDNSYNVDFSKIKIEYSDSNHKYFQTGFYDESRDDYRYIGGLSYSFVLSNSLIDKNELFSYTTLSSNELDYIMYQQNSITKDYFYSSNSIYSSIFSLDYSKISDFDLVDTNIKDFSILGTKIEKDDSSTPPSNYEKVDLTGNEALLVIPKNFNTMLEKSSHTENTGTTVIKTFLDLDYYSQNCTFGSLVDVENLKKFINRDIPFDSVVTGSSLTAFANACYEQPKRTTLSYEYDLYSGFVPMGILIYNFSKNDSSWDSPFNADYNPYGESFVWVNTDLYNYYLIPLLSNFTADIPYVDFDNTEKNLHVDSLPSFEELAKDYNLNQDSINDNLNTRAKIESLFSFVKLPFSFINNLINGTCEPLTARFPHSNTNIVLPCLSSSFSSWLGEDSYKFIQLLINGLLVYRIIISLINFTSKNFDPSDARIEVLDL